MIQTLILFICVLLDMLLVYAELMRMFDIMYPTEKKRRKKKSLKAVKRLKGKARTGSIPITRKGWQDEGPGEIKENDK